MLADMNGTLTFLLIPANRSNRVSDREVHVKAHFDYDPYEDDLIPCRELGLAFRRGDILHVVNQEDPHWWQVRCHGSEVVSLLGCDRTKLNNICACQGRRAIWGSADAFPSLSAELRALLLFFFFFFFFSFLFFSFLFTKLKIVSSQLSGRP